jgi:hypothetical protein
VRAGDRDSFGVGRQDAKPMINYPQRLKETICERAHGVKPSPTRLVPLHSALAGGKQSVQPIPCRERRWRRREHSDCRKCPFHATEIAGGTRDHDVGKAAIASASVWQNVIVLQPHALEGSVLFTVALAPRHGLWIGLVQKHSNASVNDRDTAKTAVVAIALQYLAPNCAHWHTGQGALRYRQRGRRGGVWTLPQDVLVVPPPNRFRPFADCRQVSRVKQLRCRWRIIRQMRIGSQIQE